MTQQSTADYWSDARQKLAKANKCPETDGVIDSLATHAMESPTQEATSALITGLKLAIGPLTQKSVSLAIALSARSGAVEAVDAIVDAFRNVREDAFLGPALLDALFVLGCRDPLARSELSSHLQRIDKHANPYLVGKAATLSGRLLQIGLCPELRANLIDFADSPHEEASAEAKFYLACMETREIVSADNRDNVVEALKKSATAFQLAGSRPDAMAMQQLMQLFLMFCEGSDDDECAKLASSTQVAFSQWPGYESPSLTFFLVGIERSIDALNVARAAVNGADSWLNIQTGLISLSEALQSLSTCWLGESFLLVQEDVIEIERKIVRPTVGKILHRAVGRKRLEAVLRECELTNVDCCDVLRNLLELTCRLETDSLLVSKNAQEQLQRVAEATGRHPGEIISELESALETGQVAPFVESMIPNARLLAVHGDGLFGGDPMVHRTACRLLEELRELLTPYNSEWWSRLKSTVASLVSFVYFVRDSLPQYCLCREDNGLGQTASESDLQEDVFRWLRQEFGTQSVYETGPVAGGRTDSGIRFPEVEFPIELKHEFQHVKREHISENYLHQPSDYSSARGRVTFLLILDLRIQNAASHKDNVKASKGMKNKQSPRSLYTLNDSFWCESLEVDPDIENGERTVVVIGLVPGNRPKPSSQTTYSQRPRSARKSKEGQH
ncbi:hypothetical protein AB1L42_22615 [Thalassoglobus sp. JC818]|uniref:hypothetical protein n=1 Tax=Thalassoglobus sp. JC818 TaxID=3232136 RepID=UPI0034576718